MDLNSNRTSHYPARTMDQRWREQFRAAQRRFRLFTAMRLTEILASFLMILPIFLVLSMIFGHQPRDRPSGFVDARGIEMRGPPKMSLESQKSNVLPLEDRKISVDDAELKDQRVHVVSIEDQRGSVDSLQSDEILSNKLLGRLLADTFQEDSCLSRYQSFLYRKNSTHRPSPYLISKLRAYEELHKRCGPGTQSYGKAIGLLKSNGTNGSMECKYVVWMSYSGLGNRIVSIASVFLYALLTDRVLLIDGGAKISDLFCEPFPETSWLLSSDFPVVNQFDGFGQNSPNCYGNLLRKKTMNLFTGTPPSHLYLHLIHDYNDHDKMFFCEEDQAFLSRVPWLMIRTNNYFVPSLFLIPAFEGELSKLFPEKETVFHHLGRYLFHPTNQVWGLITRYYQAYLQNANEKIGLQIRVFDEKSGISPQMTQQILVCTQGEHVLPEIAKNGFSASSTTNPKVKAVLVASLTTGYFEILKTMYWENPTVTGDVVGVHQPSHEGHQKTEKLMHNRRAWAEMYLLSLTDKLVISAWSTFGYVAQGLGGLRPWILLKADNQKSPEPPCIQAMSLEPCFHSPPYYDCKAKRGADTGNLVPHVRHCEDISWGLKVVDAS